MNDKQKKDKEKEVFTKEDFLNTLKKATATVPKPNENKGGKKKPDNKNNKGFRND